MKNKLLLKQDKGVLNDNSQNYYNTKNINNMNKIDLKEKKEKGKVYKTKQKVTNKNIKY